MRDPLEGLLELEAALNYVYGFWIASTMYDTLRLGELGSSLLK